MAAQNLVNTKQDVISAMVQRELLNNASLLPFLRDLSAMAVKGAKSIAVPKLSSVTVGDRAFGAAGTESAALTDSVDTLLLDKNKYVNFGFDSHDETQATISYLAELIKRSSAAHGRQINDDIITEWEAVGGLNINAGVPADITIDDILDMREFLMSNFADMNTARLIIAADQEKAMLKLAEFSRFDIRGGGESATVTGQIGNVYGVPVIINQQVKPSQAFMVTPEGSAFAFQRSPAIAQDTNLLYGTGGQTVVVDCLYGVRGMNLGSGTAAAGKSPLVAQLID